jgi:crotonobetainyl-CoA:carnitine CoA-transferase CaiB-like acyl-CoA transferase
MQAAPAEPVRRAPLLGEHTDTILQRRLELTTTELADLRRQAVI